MISHSSLPRRLRCCSSSGSDPKPSDPLVMILYSQFGMADEKELPPIPERWGKAELKVRTRRTKEAFTGGGRALGLRLGRSLALQRVPQGHSPLCYHLFISSRQATIYLRN